jgi:uncharacterized protein YbaR (Trm112 family)
MYSLSASELLRLWERGLANQPVERALALLCATSPDVSPEALARMSIGTRDALLLRLRERTFGPRLSSIVSCPRCRERLEFDFTTEEIAVDAEIDQQVKLFSLSVQGYEVEFRLPSSLDLSVASASAGIDEAQRSLLSRCLLSAQLDAQEKTLDELPAEVIQAVLDEMGRRDPQADVQLALSCPQCGHAWQLTFDIVSFFWSEIEAWAQRILREVHALASAYGWREEEILALSAWRRQVYLGMIGV